MNTPELNMTRKKQLQSLLELRHLVELEKLALQLVVDEPETSEWLHFYILAMIEQNKFSIELSHTIDAAIVKFTEDARFYYCGAVCAIKGENDLDKSLLYCAFALSLQSRVEAYQQLYTHLLCATSKQCVRFIFLPDWKLGHLVQEADMWYRDWQKAPQRDVYYVMVYGAELCNRTVVDLYRRKVAIADHCDFLHQVYRKKPHLLADAFVERMPLNSIEKFGRSDWVGQVKELYNFCQLHHDTRSILEINQADTVKGNGFLRQMGIDPDHDSYVCITARTNDYYTKTFKNSDIYTNVDWSFTNCRNSNFSSYQGAIDFIIEQGVYVIRIGKIVSERVEHRSDKFIDYSSDFRDQFDGDFMDVFLLSTCKFFICNSSGLVHVSQVVGVPALMVNAVPWVPPNAAECDLYVPKLLRNMADQTIVNYGKFLQLLTANNPAEHEIPFITNTSDLEKFGWEYVDNEADDLLEATKEMWARVIEKRLWSEQQQQLIDQFSMLSPQSHWISKAKIPASPSFLKKYQNELGLV